ncbi:MAG: hypothetical protein AAF733_01275 [Verrucomicrobiota bacterium]
MKKYLPILIAAALLSPFLPSVYAGGTGYYSRTSVCAASKFQTPRYNQILPYRHYEDRRRYNAAPCEGEVRYEHPYLLKTVVVRKKRVPHYTYDSHGRRYCRQVVVTTYKDVFSDGSCRIWTTHS